jgi:hypothetical protein
MYPVSTSKATKNETQHTQNLSTPSLTTIVMSYVPNTNFTICHTNKMLSYKLHLQMIMVPHTKPTVTKSFKVIEQMVCKSITYNTWQYYIQAYKNSLQLLTINGGYRCDNCVCTTSITEILRCLKTQVEVTVKDAFMCQQ